MVQGIRFIVWVKRLLLRVSGVVFFSVVILIPIQTHLFATLPLYLHVSVNKLSTKLISYTVVYLVKLVRSR